MNMLNHHQVELFLKEMEILIVRRSLVEWSNGKKKVRTWDIVQSVGEVVD